MSPRSLHTRLRFADAHTRSCAAAAAAGSESPRAHRRDVTERYGPALARVRRGGAEHARGGLYGAAGARQWPIIAFFVGSSRADFPGH